MILSTSLRRWQLSAAAGWLLMCLAVTVNAFTCKPCNKPCFNQRNFPVVLPAGLSKDDFNSCACLVDPSLDCRLSHEFSSSSRPSAAERGFPANSWDAKTYCESCFLYFNHCTKSDGSMNTGTLQFVHNGVSATSAKGHALVMPNQPCRGVEAWQNDRCGGEAAWDAAFKRWTSDGGSAKSYFGFVLAVNSMEKRTQHQLHLHVGTLVAGVKTALQAGYKWANSQQPAKSKFLIACAKPGTDITCKFDASKQLTSQNTISVDIAAGATPSVVKPFETVYGPNAKGGNPPSPETIKNSMGVVASADKEWLILKLYSGAAECLLADDQIKCSVTAPKATAADADDVAAPDAAAAADPADEGVAAAAAGVAAATPVDEPSSSSSNAPGRRMKL